MFVCSIFYFLARSHCNLYGCFKLISLHIRKHKSVYFVQLYLSR